jgi:translation initiation factor IF-2
LPKVHFFRLAQQLKVDANKLLKQLKSANYDIHSTSSQVEDDVAQRIREFVKSQVIEQKDAEPIVAEPVTTEPIQKAPVQETKPVEQVNTKIESAGSTEKVEKVEKVETTEKTEKAPELPKEQRVVKVMQNRPDGTKPPEKKKKKHNFMISTDDGGLSPDADFGIVKAAVLVNITPPPQRGPGPGQGGNRQGGGDNRNNRPGGGPGQGQGGQGQGGPGGQGGGFRPGGDNRNNRPGGGPNQGPGGQGNFQNRGPNRPPVIPAGPPPDPAAAKPGAAKVAGPAKKKQKRTVFGDKDNKPFAAKKPTTAFTSTTIKSRKKRSKDATKSNPDQLTRDIPIIITGHITVGELAERALISPAQIITQLITMGTLATVNQQIEPALAVEVLEKLEIEALYESDLVEHADWRLTATSSSNDETAGETRPPVVTILGHVDHGKTTLLDSIRKTSVTESEFGGITQHIGAYQVTINDRKITFLDTPGHAAFTAMRARGANMTDIAVLVVAADDGIQPQTVEAIDHAKAAKVPIIVAINKIDSPGAQVESVKQQLTIHELVSEEWGGDTIIVEVSAKKNINIDQLLEMILLVADVADLKSDATKPARGAVVESKLDKQRGPVATVLVQEGTLRVGDAIVAGMISGKIRAMADEHGKSMKEAGPSTPVEITGLSEVPVAGDLFITVADEKIARTLAEDRNLKARDERLQAHVSLQNLSSLVASGLVKDLNLIIKADVAGSIEAISQVLSQIEHSEIRVNIIHAGVGDVTESDVLLASASNAIILGFHVKAESQARLMAEEASIDVRIYQVIYDLADDVQKAMIGMLTPIFEESILGNAEVRMVFKVSRVGVIAGCYVKNGLIRRNAKVHIKRNGETIHTSNLDSLKHLKEEVREMAAGFECGIGIDGYSDWEEGDIIECFIMKELRRETL